MYVSQNFSYVAAYFETDIAIWTLFPEYKTCFPLTNKRQVPALSMSFLSLGIGNTLTTLIVIPQKLNEQVCEWAGQKTPLHAFVCVSYVAVVWQWMERV